MGEKQESSKIDLLYASDFMTENVVTVKQTDTIDEVAHTMLR
ncbi:MAG: CBS domain-containing protein [Lysobacterales bacterium]|jgi:CBS domain-containing protein